MKPVQTLVLIFICSAFLSAQPKGADPLPPTVKKLLVDNALVFNTPDGYSAIAVEKNPQMNYDFALKTAIGDMEVRYAVHSDKSSTGENEMGNMAIALNVSKEKNPGELRGSSFPPASVKKEFGCEAGGIFMIQSIDPAFSTKYPSCLMMYLNRKGVGNVYAFLLFNEMNETVVREALYSIKYISMDEVAGEAVDTGDLAKLNDALAKGANPNANDEYSQTLLQRAIPTNGSETAKNVEIIKKLLAAGANPNLTSNFGTTPLHTAAYYGLKQIVKLLLDAGADPTVISTISGDKTPIEMATSNNMTEMAKLLETQALKFPGMPKIGMDSKVTYTVDFYAKKYKFIIDIIQDEPEIVFNWKMTTDRGDKEGNISMSAEAVQSATQQYNLFENGEIVLDDKTSVWVSREVFKSLRSGVETTMNAMGEDKTFVRKNVPTGTEVMADGKSINVIYAEALDGSEKFWILNNPKMPLIMKMDLGWKIDIEKIE